MEDLLVFPFLLVSFLEVYQVVTFPRLRSERLDGGEDGDGGDGVYLGQFHGLSCSGGSHLPDSRKPGDIFTRERPGEERGLNDYRLISTVGCKSDPRVRPLILFSIWPIESIIGGVKCGTSALV